MSTITARPVEVDQPKIPVKGIVTTLVAALVLVTAVVLSQQAVTEQPPASVTNQEAVAYWQEITAVIDEAKVSTGSSVVDQAIANSATPAAQQAATARLEGLAASFEAVGQRAHAERMQVFADAIAGGVAEATARAEAATTARLEGLAAHHSPVVVGWADEMAAYWEQESQKVSVSTVPSGYEAMVEYWEQRAAEYSQASSQKAQHEAEVNGLLALVD